MSSDYSSPRRRSRLADEKDEQIQLAIQEAAAQAKKAEERLQEKLDDANEDLRRFTRERNEHEADRCKREEDEVKHTINTIESIRDRNELNEKVFNYLDTARRQPRPGSQSRSASSNSPSAQSASPTKRNMVSPITLPSRFRSPLKDIYGFAGRSRSPTERGGGHDEDDTTSQISGSSYTSVLTNPETDLEAIRKAREERKERRQKLKEDVMMQSLENLMSKFSDKNESNAEQSEPSPVRQQPEIQSNAPLFTPTAPYVRRDTSSMLKSFLKSPDVGSPFTYNFEASASLEPSYKSIGDSKSMNKTKAKTQDIWSEQEVEKAQEVLDSPYHIEATKQQVNSLDTVDKQQEVENEANESSDPTSPSHSFAQRRAPSNEVIVARSPDAERIDLLAAKANSHVFCVDDNSCLIECSGSIQLGETAQSLKFTSNAANSISEEVQTEKNSAESKSCGLSSNSLKRTIIGDVDFLNNSASDAGETIDEKVKTAQEDVPASTRAIIAEEEYTREELVAGAEKEDTEVKACIKPEAFVQTRKFYTAEMEQEIIGHPDSVAHRLSFSQTRLLNEDKHGSISSFNSIERKSYDLGIDVAGDDVPQERESDSKDDAAEFRKAYEKEPTVQSEAAEMPLEETVMSSYGDILKAIEEEHASSIASEHSFMSMKIEAVLIESQPGNQSAKSSTHSQALAVTQSLAPSIADASNVKVASAQSSILAVSENTTTDLGSEEVSSERNAETKPNQSSPVVVAAPGPAAVATSQSPGRPRFVPQPSKLSHSRPIEEERPPFEIPGPPLNPPFNSELNLAAQEPVDSAKVVSPNDDRDGTSKHRPFGSRLSFAPPETATMQRERILIRVKGKRKMYLTRMGIGLDSFNRGDVFVYQHPEVPANSTAKLFIFFGKDASKLKKAKGVEIALRLKDREWASKATVYEIEDLVSSREALEFWKLVIGPVWDGKVPKVKSAKDGGDDDKFEKELDNKLVLYSTTKDSNSDNWGKLPPAAKGKGLSMKHLDGEMSFVLDAGVEVYIWSGKASTEARREAARLFADHLAASRNSAVVFERNGVESILFKEMFVDWSDGMSIDVKQLSNVVIPDKGRGTYDQAGANVQKQDKISITKMISPSLRPASWGREEGQEEVILADYGIVQRTVWVMNDNVEGTDRKTEIPEDEHGVFYSSESYIVRYTFRNEKDKHDSVLFYWIGCDTPVADQGILALEVIEMGKSTGFRQIRVVQGKEPDYFFKAFVPYVIRRGWRESFDVKSKCLYELRGWSKQTLYCIQVDWSGSSFCSGSSFIVHTKDKSDFLWHGYGSSTVQVTMAQVTHETKIGGERPRIEVMENNEPKGFWSKNFDSDKSPDYAKGGYFKRRLSLGAKVRPRLFKISHIVHGNPSAEELQPFTQADLRGDSVLILDGYFEVFVWIGGEAKANYRDIKLAMETALAYSTQVGTADQDRRLSTHNVLLIRQGNEPAYFKSQFIGWNFSESHLTIEKTNSLRRILKLGSSSPSLQSPLSAMSSSSSSSSSATALSKLLSPLPVADFLATFASATYSIEQLRKKDDLPLGVDPARVEEFLKTEEFGKVFKMQRDVFLALPEWKKTELKRKFGLF